MTRTFFSGRNNDRAPARQTTRTFFSGCNNDRASARQTTVSFFSGRNSDHAPHIGFWLWRHFFPVASGTVVVCKNNTRVLGRSGPEQGKH
jgi:hypothetical protein